jgi:hypothetical protein
MVRIGLSAFFITVLLSACAAELPKSAELVPQTPNPPAGKSFTDCMREPSVAALWTCAKETKPGE